MKTAIIYESKHHGNTKKICDRIAKECGTVLVEAASVDENFNWKDYDLIGFASGIAYSRFYDHVTRAAGLIPHGKKVFFIYTCAKNDKDFAAGIKKTAADRGAVCLGSYGCRGYNTYGPLKLIGGMNRNNPNEDELQAAVDFVKKLEANHEE
ncbi:MAG: flavodoxin [Lachnospiraceae bacterium]|nr:flavodoxin [Lachnospiraceae bacterium]